MINDKKLKMKQIIKPLLSHEKSGSNVVIENAESDNDLMIEMTNTHNSNETIMSFSHISRQEFEKLQTQFERKLGRDVHFSLLSDLSDAKLVDAFDFLMPYWRTGFGSTNLYWPEKNEFLMRKTGLSLYHQLLNLLATSEKSFFHPFAFDMLCRFMCESIKTIIQNGAVVNGKQMRHLNIDPADFEKFCNSSNENYQPLMRFMNVMTAHTLQEHEKLIESDKKLKLLYYLRKGMIASFEENFVEILQKEKERLGDFSKVSLEPVMKFYIFIANCLGFGKFIELIRKDFPCLEINNEFFSIRTITTIYDAESPLESQISNVTRILTDLCIGNDKQENVEKLLNKALALKTDKEVKAAIFGRNIERRDSLFERILSFPGMGSEDCNCIRRIFLELKLSKSPEILINKNHLGKSFVEHAVDSSDPRNLKALIQSFGKYYKYFNHQLTSSTGLNLFEYYLKLVITHHDDKEILQQFFSEIILPLLEKLKGETYVNNISSLNYEKLIEKFEIGSHENNTINFNTLKFHIDQLLCLFIAYCKSEKVSEDLKCHPILKIIFQIIDGHEDEFVNTFNNSMKILENHCIKSYQIQSNTSDHISTFQMIMFTAAIIHNRPKVIELITKSNLFDETKLILPKRFRSFESAENAALKILENRKNTLSKTSDLPQNWITQKVFKQFLDSQIGRTEDGERIEINTSFLISGCDQSSSSWFSDNEVLEHIRDNTELKQLLIHPTITSYIDLKFNMYKKIFFWNFWTFFICTLVYSWLAYNIIHDYYVYSAPQSNSNPNPELHSQFRKSVIVIFVLIACRELLQIWIVRSYKKHFTFTNVAEFILILSLAVTIIMSNDMTGIFVNVTCINILIMTMLLTAMFPYDFMYQHMLLFKKVGKTFIKFLLTFMSALSAFILIFVIVFYPTNQNNKNGIAGADIINKGKEKATEESTNENDDSDKFHKNFDVEKLDVAFTKVVLMLSGEYDVVLPDLEAFQLLIFFIFVIITFICFNLIIGLTIDDVKSLKEDALCSAVSQRIRKIIQINESYGRFKDQKEKLKYSNNILKPFYYIFLFLDAFLIRFWIDRYPHLHKVDRLFINVKTRHIEMLVEDEYVHPVKFSLKRLDLEKMFLGQILKVEEQIFDDVMQVLDT